MLTICHTNCANLHELSLTNLEKGAWFNLVNPTPEELELVAATTEAPLDFLKAALDEEERSRTELDDNHLLVITNIPIMRGKDSYDALPLGIIICTEYIITVCLEPNEVIAEFKQESARQFSTFKKTRFLFQILYKSALLYLRYLKQINRRTDQLENRLRVSMKNNEIFQLLELRKGLTYFTASLRSNGIVLEKLLRLRTSNNMQHLIKMYEEDEDLLEDVITENKQAIEMVEMYSKVLSGTMDTFTSVISNNLNIVMKFLASMTILLAIPTMISSFMGMNVDVPWGTDGGFIYVLYIATAATALMAFGLWKKGMF